MRTKPVFNADPTASGSPPSTAAMRPAFLPERVLWWLRGLAFFFAPVAQLAESRSRAVVGSIPARRTRHHNSPRTCLAISSRSEIVQRTMFSSIHSTFFSAQEKFA